MNNSTLTQSNLINLENNNNQNISMTTVEIAKLTGKMHQHVMRDCEVQLSKVCMLANFGEHYKISNGNTYKCYRLPEREVLILVSGYSVELRAKIIDELNRLRQELINRLPQNYEEALERLLIEVRENKKLEAKIKEDEPKVQSYENVISTKGLLSIEVFAKEYFKNIGRNKIFDYLREAGILNNENLPYQRYMNYFEVKQKTYIKNDKKCLYHQVYVKIDKAQSLYKTINNF